MTQHQPTKTLSAVLLHDVWCVRDADGGVWHPDTTAERVIASAGEQAAAVAVDLCRSAPMRGTWHS
jgi:hypothetical protein